MNRSSLVILVGALVTTGVILRTRELLVATPVTASSVIIGQRPRSPSPRSPPISNADRLKDVVAAASKALDVFGRSQAARRTMSHMPGFEVDNNDGLEALDNNDGLEASDSPGTFANDNRGEEELEDDRGALNVYVVVRCSLGESVGACVVDGYDIRRDADL